MTAPDPRLGEIEACDTGTAEKPCGGCPDCGPSSTKRTLSAIWERLGKVSDGPWRAWDRGIGYEVHGPDGEPINSRHRETFTKGDAEFIASSVGDVAYLLAELRKRDEQIAKVARIIRAHDHDTSHMDAVAVAGWAGETITDIRAAVADATGGGDRG